MRSPISSRLERGLAVVGRRALLAGLALVVTTAAGLGTAHAAAGRIPVVVDLDVGDDIDDAFALAWLLASPEIDLRGISAVWGDTALRVRLVRRLLGEMGRQGEVPVAAGPPTANPTVFTQARWAGGPYRPGAAPPEPAASTAADAVELLLREASRRPGEVTLLALGPLTNVAAAAVRDPLAFGNFRRIVMMGGSVREGYRRSGYDPPRPPDPEYNIASDVAAARTVFAAGVPIVMFPVDSTSVRLDDTKRAALFRHGSALTDALTLLYAQWTAGGQPWAGPIPTLFDVVPVAWLLDPPLCPTTPLRIEVDAAGLTREVPGPPNAEVCLRSDGDGVLDRMVRTLLRWDGAAIRP